MGYFTLYQLYQGDLTTGDSTGAGTQLSTERQVSLGVQRIKSLGEGRILTGSWLLFMWSIHIFLPRTLQVKCFPLLITAVSHLLSFRRLIGNIYLPGYLYFNATIFFLRRIVTDFSLGLLPSTLRKVKEAWCQQESRIFVWIPIKV